MSSTHSEALQSQVNPRGWHLTEWERHPCYLHADLIDTGSTFFRAGPGPRVVELVGPLHPLYYRQSDKIARRAGRGQALFWLTQRQLLRLTRGMHAWFREPPPDSELLLAEVVVNVWLPGADPRRWNSHPYPAAEPPRPERHPVYGDDLTREASDFIPYRRDPHGSGRRRYVPVPPEREG
jgi:hypothetical protein